MKKKTKLGRGLKKALKEAISIQEKFPHYWMCYSCAKNMGGTWPEGHCATVCISTCKYCGTEDVTIIPWVDFEWDNIQTRHLRD